MARIQDQVVASIAHGKFDTEAECLDALAAINCKPNYYGVGDLDPYVEGPRCVWYAKENKWLPSCKFKMNTLSGVDNANKFLETFKNSPTIDEYLNIIGRYCEGDPTHELCLNVFEMYYNVAIPNDPVRCGEYNMDKCVNGRYGTAPTDPFVVQTPCVATGQHFTPTCRLKSYPVTDGLFATRIYSDFGHPTSASKLDFLLKSYCKDKAGNPVCSREYTIVTKEGLSEGECFNTADEKCAAGIYGEDSTDPMLGSNGCYKSEDGLWYSWCVARSGAINDPELVQKFYNDFNEKNPNETAEIIKQFCNNSNNVGIPECKRSVDPCIASPWLVECGSTGNKCEITPDAIECNEPCLSSPWLLECRGTGNKCDYTPDSFDCQEPCLSSPWLLECGGDGDKCKHTPDATECQEPCLSNPWLTECGGTGNKCDYTPNAPECKEPCLSNPDAIECQEPCLSSPWLLQCRGTGNKCDYTPDAIECKEPCLSNPDAVECKEPCISNPWLTSCNGTGNKCEYTPNAVECKEPCLSSPWLLECGGDGDKCKHTPDAVECKEPCLSNPDAVECKEQCVDMPWLTECGGSGNKCDYTPNASECDVCVTDPGTQKCCSKNPKHSSCLCFLFPGLDRCKTSTINRWVVFIFAILFILLIYKITK